MNRLRGKYCEGNMKYPEVAHLYKYYPYNSNSLSVLINRCAWYSKPASLNDPFDLAIDFADQVNSRDIDYMINRCLDNPGISDEKRRKLTEAQELERSLPDPVARQEACMELNKGWRKVLNNSGVFCLSEVNNNIMMWSHYADCHRGFCVEFVRSPQNILGDTETTNPVHYSRHYPSPFPFSDQGVERCYDKLLLTKSIEWAYEKEWRLLNEKGDIAVPLPEDIISAVIFGLQMSSQHKETIKNILSGQPGVAYRQAEKVPNSFKLKIVNSA